MQGAGGRLSGCPSMPNARVLTLVVGTSHIQGLPLGLPERATQALARPSAPRPGYSSRAAVPVRQV